MNKRAIENKTEQEHKNESASKAKWFTEQAAEKKQKQEIVIN